MFGSGTTPGLFGSSPAPSAFGSGSSPLIFGASSAPAFGATSTPAFGASSTPIFGASSTPSLFGSTSTPLFGASSSLSIFGASSSSSMFGSSSSPGLFGSSSTPSLFGTPPQSGGLFGSASQLSFGQATPFGQTQASLFGQPQQQQPSPFGSSLGSPFGQAQTPFFGQAQAQAQTPMFGGMQPSIFGQSTSAFGQVQPTILGTPQQPLFTGSQLITQMAPVAPMSIPLPDREVQAIVDAYKDDPGNPRYGFRHLLLSVTDASMRAKPLGISDIMWAEAMNKLEGMDSKDRERLWPELVQGFKDLSRRLKLQDEALAADVQRLRATESNVKLLRRHFEIDTLPWVQRLRQKEQELQRRLLKAMRIVEALEGKGFRLPLTKGETRLGERLRTLSQQLRGPRAELPRRVNALLSLSRMQASVGVSQTSLLGMGTIDEQSLADMHKVLRQQTEAITRLVNVLKRDMRDLEIMIPENVDIPNGHAATY